MIFVNGQPFTQVLASSQLQPGTFFVDETHGQISIEPAAGTNLSTATVEVAVRQNLLSIQNKSDVVLRGLTFEHSDSCRWNAAAVSISAVQQKGSNILVDTDNFLWNNGQGLVFTRKIAIDDQYMFTVSDEVANRSSRPVQIYPYGYVARDGVPDAAQPGR